MGHPFRADDNGYPDCCPLPEGHPDHDPPATIATQGHRDGATFSPADDAVRLNAQATRVYETLATGAWYTLADLHEITGDPEASCSARIRDLRKPQFGEHSIERRRVPGGTGLWEYRMLVPTTADRTY